MLNRFQVSKWHLSRQHLSMWHLSISGISQLLLSYFYPTLKDRYRSTTLLLGSVASITESSSGLPSLILLFLSGYSTNFRVWSLTSQSLILYFLWNSSSPLSTSVRGGRVLFLLILGVPLGVAHVSLEADLSLAFLAGVRQLRPGPWNAKAS